MMDVVSDGVGFENEGGASERSVSSETTSSVVFVVVELFFACFNSFFNRSISSLTFPPLEKI